MAEKPARLIFPSNCTNKVYNERKFVFQNCVLVLLKAAQKFVVQNY